MAIENGDDRKSLQDEIADLKEKLSNETGKCAVFAESHKIVKKELNESNKNVEILNAQIQQFREELKAAESKVNSSSNRLNEQSKELEDIKIKSENDKETIKNLYKEVQKLEAEIKSLTSKLHVPAQSVASKDSSRTELNQLKTRVYELQRDNNDLRTSNQNLLKKIETADYEGYWAKKYDKLFNSQGSYENGLRDGSLNYASIYQQKMEDMESVSGF